MPQDALAATTAAIENLSAATARLADAYGDTLGVRRLVSDVARFNTDLAELGDPQPAQQRKPEEVVVIDDKPYDDRIWDHEDSEAWHAS
ncbi:MAG: hypothetical protein HZY75_01285 [Nocardioidaceae bacterium]|nr:MAG: hypothetical protein HZY75_01285 [Nocardioidaceae bacterium]